MNTPKPEEGLHDFVAKPFQHHPLQVKSSDTNNYLFKEKDNYDALENSTCDEDDGGSRLISEKHVDALTDWAQLQREYHDVVSSVSKLLDTLEASIEEETLILDDLQTKAANVGEHQNKLIKQTKKCKLFEVNIIAVNLKTCIETWNLAYKRQEQLSSYGEFLHLSLVRIHCHYTMVSEMKVLLRRELKSALVMLEDLICLGLRIVALTGVEAFSSGILQKAVVGVAAFNDVTEYIQKWSESSHELESNVNVEVELRSQISIPKMLSIMAEERASLLAALMINIFNGWIANSKVLQKQSSAKSDDEYIWFTDDEARQWNGEEAGHSQDAQRHARSGSDYGSDNGECSQQQQQSEGEQSNELPSSDFQNALNKLQTAVSQEELNLARLVSIIHFTFMDVQGGPPNSRRQSQLKRWRTVDEDRAIIEASDLGSTVEQGLINNLSAFYTRILERKIEEVMKRMLEYPTNTSNVLDTLLLTPSQLVCLGNCSLQLCHTAESQLSICKVYKSLKSHFYLNAACTSWDTEMSKGLAMSSDHRRLTPVLSATSPGTQAGESLIKCLTPLIGLESMLDKDSSLDVELIQANVFPRLLASLELVSTWLETWTRHSLASWKMPVFCLIIYGDLKKIADLLKYTANVNPIQRSVKEGGVVVGGQSCVALREAMLQQLSTWEKINAAVARIQNYSSGAVKDFCRVCSQKISAELKQMMPQGKTWRQCCRKKGIPVECSPYAHTLVHDVLGPVVDGACRLPTPSQISILTMATKVFCESWMAHILSRQMKFSLHGAHLLKLDFGHLVAFVHSQPSLSIETRQSILSLEILRQLKGSANLLLRQTEAPVLRLRQRKVVPLASNPDQEGHEELEEVVDETAASGSHADEEYVPNKEQWLSLRACRTRSGYRAPFWCFS